MKLTTGIQKILSPYYQNFFGIDGPISSWLNDYIIKYGHNCSNNVFDFLESYVSLVNNSKLCDTNIQKLFQYNYRKISNTKWHYELQLIPKNEVIYEVGKYYLGECITVKIPIYHEMMLGETTLEK